MRNNGEQEAWRHESKCEEHDEHAQDLQGNKVFTYFHKHQAVKMKYSLIILHVFPSTY